MKSEPKARRPRRKRERDAERVFEGLGVAPGIGIGQVHVVEAGAITISEYEIAEDKVDEELERFHGAVQKSEKQLRKLSSKAEELHGAAAEELGFLLEAHKQMLTGSRVTRGVETRIREHRVNAEAAVQFVISKVEQDFASLDDPYLAARADDVREVGNRILRNLTQTAYEAFKNLPAGSIVVAEELTPSDTALLDPKTIEGFATVLGGKEGHTAIMARSLGIPAVLGIPELLRFARTGQEIIVDGGVGRVILNPSPAHRRGLSAPAGSAGARREAAQPPAQAALRHARRPAHRPARQRRVAARGGDGDGCRRGGRRFAAHRVHVHEPRGRTRRGRAVPGAAPDRRDHGGPAGHHPHPRRRRREAGAEPARPYRRLGQSGARPARHPPQPEAPRPAGRPVGGDPARRSAWAGAHPACR